MDKQNSIADFIHLLPTHASVVSFDGEIVDVNKWTLKGFNALSKIEILNFSVYDLIFDKTKFDRLIDYLLVGNVIQNQNFFLRTKSGEFVERKVSASILSYEKQLVFIEKSDPIEQSNHSFHRDKTLLAEMRKLLPYLNKTGRELLDQIHNTQLNHIEKNEKNARVNYVSAKLSKEFPELTNAELYLCSLILMGFSSREISHFSGFSPNSIRVNIHRLCRKYEVQSRDELFSLLTSSVNGNNSFEPVSYHLSLLLGA